MQPLISIVILTHNKLDVTRRCLPTLLETRYAPWELVVVDNGSTDGTPAWLDAFAQTAATRGVPVTVLRNPGNIGCSTSRNQGAAAARGALIGFADNDVALRDVHWLTQLGARFARDPAVGMVGPKLVYPYAPHAIQNAGTAVSRSGRILFRGRGESREDPRFNVEDEVQCLISACCLASRRAFEAAAGFDEAFNPVEYEDLDLCYRMRQLGYRLLYVPAVELYHFESVTTAGTPSLPNTRLIIEHGLLFKQRWRHMFESENGPPDAATAWRKLKVRPLAEIGDLPLRGE